MVSGKENVGLVRVEGRERGEEVDDVAGGGPPVAVVAEEDDEGGGEEMTRECGVEVGPEVCELRYVAVDVTDTDDGAWLLLRRRFHDVWKPQACELYGNTSFNLFRFPRNEDNKKKSRE